MNLNNRKNYFHPDFRKAFLLFDKDGNGRITADELSEVMSSLGQSPTKKEVEAMIQKADQDGEYVYGNSVRTVYRSL